MPSNNFSAKLASDSSSTGTAIGWRHDFVSDGVAQMLPRLAGYNEKMRFFNAFLAGTEGQSRELSH
jgi:hypothetical protein